MPCVAGSSHQTRLTRFLYVAPCVRGTLPQQGGFLPEHRRRYPVAIPLYPSPPSGWVWDLLNFQIKGKLSAPFRMRAVPGTQQSLPADRKKRRPLKITLASHAQRKVDNMDDLKDKIQSIIENRIFKAAASVKKHFPKSIANGTTFFVSFGNEKLHVIIFLDNSERPALENRIKNKFDPFPGLITTESGVGAAFRMENAKNAIIEQCTVKNSYALSLGLNSSIILIDHNQEIKTKELGVLKYKIDLAFILSFPEDQSLFDPAEAFDDLISYFVSTRRDIK